MGMAKGDPGVSASGLEGRGQLRTADGDGDGDVSVSGSELQGSTAEEGLGAEGIEALALAVSEKVALLGDEVKMVKDVTAMLERLDWERDAAPLTVMLLFWGVDLRGKWEQPGSV